MPLQSTVEDTSPIPCLPPPPAPPALPPPLLLTLRGGSTTTTSAPASAWSGLLPAASTQYSTRGREAEGGTTAALAVVAAASTCAQGVPGLWPVTGGKRLGGLGALSEGEVWMLAAGMPRVWAEMRKGARPSGLTSTHLQINKGSGGTPVLWVVSKAVLQGVCWPAVARCSVRYAAIWLQETCKLSGCTPTLQG